MVMRESTTISERHACLLVGLSRTVLHYDSKVQPENEQLQARLVELAGERRRFGYRRLHALVRREGVQANHKRIYRLYSDAVPTGGYSLMPANTRHYAWADGETIIQIHGLVTWGIKYVNAAEDPRTAGNAH